MPKKNYKYDLCTDYNCRHVSNSYENKNDRCLWTYNCDEYNMIYYIFIPILTIESLILLIFLLIYHSDNYFTEECSAPYINLFSLLMLNIYLLTTLCFSNSGRHKNKYENRDENIHIYERWYVKLSYIINGLFRIWSFVSYLYLIINTDYNYEEIIHDIFNNITNETETTIFIEEKENKYFDCANDEILGSLLMSSIILLLVLTCITLYYCTKFIKYCNRKNQERIKKYNESKLAKKEFELKSTKKELKTKEQKIEELETQLRITESKLNSNNKIVVAKVVEQVMLKEDV